MAIQVLKQRVPRRLRRKKRANAGRLNLSFESRETPQPRFWQRRFYDFRVRALLGARSRVVWSLKKRVEKLHYMHMNPLKRKLVPHPRDWLWSSFSFYAKRDAVLVRIDPMN
jgi:hypothetical protein